MCIRDRCMLKWGFLVVCVYAQYLCYFFYFLDVKGKGRLLLIKGFVVSVFKTILINILMKLTFFSFKLLIAVKFTKMFIVVLFNYIILVTSNNIIMFLGLDAAFLNNFNTMHGHKVLSTFNKNNKIYSIKSFNYSQEGRILTIIQDN